MDRKILEKLYLEDRLSMAAISKKLSISRNKVYWWMSKYNIKLRSRSEQSTLQFDPLNDFHKIIVPSSNEEHYLMGLGLGLYWGEGNKVDPFAVRLGNTDPLGIIAFVNFLTQICSVRQNKIKFGLQIFNDIDEIEAIEYWMKTLKRPRESFHNKIVVIPSQGKGTYRKKSRYGVIQLYVSDKRLKTWIMSRIAEISTEI